MPVLNTADAVYLGAQPVDAVYLGADKVWPPPPTGGAWGPDESLYPVSVAPAGPADANAFMVGNRITVLADGRITGLRYHSHGAMVASRYVALWSDTGTVLAEATVAGEVAGWNVAPITPVAVAAGQIVRPAYGYYGSAISGSFSYLGVPPVSASPRLQWEAGVYTTPAPFGGGNERVFPSNTITPNNYFGDVVYQEQLVAAAPSYADEVLADSPLGYWRLGEGGPWFYGMPAPDATGRRAGTYTGAPTLGVAGLLRGDQNPADTAMQVAGANGQGMQLADHADYELGTLTLEAWVKTTNAGASFRSIAVKQNAYGIFAIDGMLGTYVWGTATIVNTGATIQDGAPHHVAVVLREGVAGGSQFYRDGVPVGAAFTYTTQSHGQPLDVGYNSFGGQEFIGVIDEVALYPTALSAGRIAAHATAGVA